MENTSKVYRIRTKVGSDAPNVIDVSLEQTYDMFEILSLKLNQQNTYKTYDSDYGVIVGRVTANGGFGVPNAKVSIFIEVSDDETEKNKLLYNFTSTHSKDNDGIRYNLLPDYVDDACHQNIGTFPNKRLVLDNSDVLEVFDKYWKYTTVTNHAGDYMLFGVPTGSQNLHVDVDLSDCGILSQRPRDLVGKGYNENLFESPNKFKTSTNLNSLAQVISQDKGLYVYPYWGDVTDTPDKFSITRCDIDLDYKFESTAVFIGCIITDKGSNAIAKDCTGTDKNGKMSDLIAGEGKIEMIRKTLDGKVEEYPIMGNRLIDGDGVWCYQIPMNLDYVTTDEFGSIVPTDNPDKGIATRARVRFRISMDENPNDASARKRARYLVPNNPRMEDDGFRETLKPDFEFGTSTRDESYCDLLWNKVYTVKNYIPKIQKNRKPTNRKHTGIKLINHHDDNNPMPYNGLTIKLTFTYRLICVLTEVLINIIEFVNELISIVGALFGIVKWILEIPAKLFEDWACIKLPLIGRVCPLSFLGGVWRTLVYPIVYILDLVTPPCIPISSNFCDDGINKITYYPGCGYFIFKLFEIPGDINASLEKTINTHEEREKDKYPDPQDCAENCTVPNFETAMLFNCVQNELAQSNDATSFNFYNDWVNGVLYAPLWYRKITPKKSFFFGLFKRNAKDDWCTSERQFSGSRIIQHCALGNDMEEIPIKYQNFDGKEISVNGYRRDECGDKCHEEYIELKPMNGVIVPKLTMLGETVYYYSPGQYDPSLPTNDTLDDSKKTTYGEFKLLFATDIVLLGSLNECDLNGIPQFFKSLESTTYNLPTDVLFSNYQFRINFDSEGEAYIEHLTQDDVDITSEMAGCDWGNPNEFDTYDGGLFYSIGCSAIDMKPKSCINLSRMCEYGVSLDETKFIPEVSELKDDNDAYERLVTDGFISYDELYNLDERSMFATMNGNRLKTRKNAIGVYEYDFRYLYPENFDGSMKKIMQRSTRDYGSDVNYRENYQLENFSKDYYVFRMGNNPYYYDPEEGFPRYENSFYFYFGLKAGKTAIEKFNAKYFAECTNPDSVQSHIGVKSKGNTWCSEVQPTPAYDGYILFDFSSVSLPCSMIINSMTDSGSSWTINNIENDKWYLGEYSGGDAVPKGVMIPNDTYLGVITDANGEINEFTFKVEDTYLSYDVTTQNFEQPNNVLLKMFNDDYDAIAQNRDGLPDSSDMSATKMVKRNIGGVLTVRDVFLGNSKDFSYKITLMPKVGSVLYNKYFGVKIYCHEDEEYHTYKIYDENNNQIVDNNYKSVIYIDGSHNYYGFGLPYGGIIYTVTITQVCNVNGVWVDTKNTISKDVVVNQPMPYKLFINNIDYDLIKRFDSRSGWTIDGNTLLRNVGFNAYTRNDDSLKRNPWLNYVDNVFFNTRFNNIKYLKYNIVYEEEKIIIKSVDNNNIEAEIDLDVVFNEFIPGRERNSIMWYNWVDEYAADGYDEIGMIGIDNIADYIKKVNKAITLRKELPAKMKNAFYLTCPDQTKTIYFRIQTSDLPGVSTVAYLPEVEIEFSGKNGLDNRMTVEDTNMINKIRIPTISYNSSSNYGTGVSDDYPCLVSVDGITKTPYSVAAMNYKGISIPQNIEFELRDGLKCVNRNSCKVADMFDFPIVDKIMSINNVSWTPFNSLPKYGNGNVGMVTMNGFLAGVVINGNVQNNEYEKQTLYGKKLVLSEDINRNNDEKYVEKRVFLGYEDESDFVKNFTNYYVYDITQHTDEERYRNKYTAETISTNAYVNMQEQDKLTYEKIYVKKTVDVISQNQSNYSKYHYYKKFDEINENSGKTFNVKNYVIERADIITFKIIGKSEYIGLSETEKITRDSLYINKPNQVTTTFVTEWYYNNGIAKDEDNPYSEAYMIKDKGVISLNTYNSLWNDTFKGEFEMMYQSKYNDSDVKSVNEYNELEELKKYIYEPAFINKRFYIFTTDEYESMSSRERFNYEFMYLNLHTLDYITVNDYQDIQYEYDKYLYIPGYRNRLTGRWIYESEYNELPQEEKSLYDPGWVNKYDRNDFLTNQQVSEDPLIINLYMPCYRVRNYRYNTITYTNYYDLSDEEREKYKDAFVHISGKIVTDSEYHLLRPIDAEEYQFAYVNRHNLEDVISDSEYREVYDSSLEYKLIYRLNNSSYTYITKSEYDGLTYYVVGYHNIVSGNLYEEEYNDLDNNEKNKYEEGWLNNENRSLFITNAEYNALDEDSRAMYVRGYRYKLYIDQTEYDRLTDGQKSAYEKGWITRDKSGFLSNAEYRSFYEVKQMLYERMYGEKLFLTETEYDKLSDDGKSLYIDCYISSNQTISERRYNQLTPTQREDYSEGGYRNKFIQSDVKTDEEYNALTTEQKYAYYDIWGDTQYCPLRDSSTKLVINDFSYCSVTKLIDVSNPLVLSSDCVNDCRYNARDYVKMLKFDISEDNEHMFYIMYAGDRGQYYPINKANFDGRNWVINDNISEPYDGEEDPYNPQKLFSFYTSENVLMYRSYHYIFSQIKHDAENGDDEWMEDTWGYGNTGVFILGGRVNNQYLRFAGPVFVVAVNKENERSLSPVYDFSNVYGCITAEKVRKLILNWQESETCRFGAGIAKFNTIPVPYYFMNYDYEVSCYAGDSVLNFEINVPWQRVTVNQNNRNQFIFVYTDIPENIFSIFKTDYALNLIGVNYTKIYVKDCVGLTHICNMKNNECFIKRLEYYEHRWYSIPEGEEFEGLTTLNKVGFNIPNDDDNTLYNDYVFKYLEENSEGDGNEPHPEQKPYLIERNNVIESQELYFYGWRYKNYAVEEQPLDIKTNSFDNSDNSSDKVGLRYNPNYFEAVWKRMWEVTFVFLDNSEKSYHVYNGSNASDIRTFNNNHWSDKKVDSDFNGKTWEVNGERVTTDNLINVTINGNTIIQQV